MHVKRKPHINIPRRCWLLWKKGWTDGKWFDKGTFQCFWKPTSVEVQGRVSDMMVTCTSVKAPCWKVQTGFGATYAAIPCPRSPEPWVSLCVELHQLHLISIIDTSISARPCHFQIEPLNLLVFAALQATYLRLSWLLVVALCPLHNPVSYSQQSCQLCFRFLALAPACAQAPPHNQYCFLHNPCLLECLHLGSLDEPRQRLCWI